MDSGNLSLSNVSSDEGDRVSEGMFQAVGILSCVVSALGVPGNALVILSVCLNRHLRTAPNVLVLNLSVCDFLSCSVVVPFHAWTFLTRHPPLPNLCPVIGYISRCLLASSILSTGAIALNRYIAIVVNSKYRQISGRRALLLMISVVYLYPLTLYGLVFTGKFGRFDFHVALEHCSWVDENVLRVISVFCMVLFPLVFMTYCYIRIVIQVISSRKGLGALGEANRAGKTQGRTESRVSRMLAMVYIVYMFTALPGGVVYVLGSVIFVSKSAVLMVVVVIWTSSAINPIVYGLVNEKYRNAYKSVVVRILRLNTEPKEQSQTTESTGNRGKISDIIPDN